MSNSNSCHLAWIVAVLALAGCTSNISIPADVSNGLVSKTSSSLPIQATVDLGVVLQGESSRINQWLQNQSDKEIHAEKIETSCECLEVRLSESQIASGGRVLALFTYDGAKESDFVGSLLIEVTLSDSNGTIVGKVEIPIEVISKTNDPNL